MQRHLNYAEFPYPQEGDPPKVRVNAAFLILSDSYVRMVLQKLKAGPVAEPYLAHLFDVSADEMRTTLFYLEKVGLVSWTKSGETRFYHLEKAGFEPVVGWFFSLGVVPERDQAV